MSKESAGEIFKRHSKEIRNRRYHSQDRQSCVVVKIIFLRDLMQLNKTVVTPNTVVFCDLHCNNF